MNLKPLLDNILIEPLAAEQKTASGILIPDTAKEKPQQGKIIAVGPGRVSEEGKTVSLNVKEGQIVLYKKWGGNDVKVDGKEMLIVKEEDILAIVE